MNGLPTTLSSCALEPNLLLRQLKCTFPGAAALASLSPAASGLFRMAAIRIGGHSYAPGVTIWLRPLVVAKAEASGSVR
jgi:hypothetical protein